MTCEAYREQLSGALLRGDAALTEMLAAHMRSCVRCTEFYEARKRLLGAMDSGVRAMVNEEVPASLLPRVKARIEAEGVGRSPLPWRFGAVAAAGVLVLIIFSPVLRNKPRMKDVSPTIVTDTRPHPDAPVGRIPPAQSEPAPSVLPSRNAKREAIHATGRTEPGAPELEVLIDPAEARGLRQLAKAAVRDPQWAQAMSRPGKLLVTQDDKIRPREFPHQEMRDFDDDPAN